VARARASDSSPVPAAAPRASSRWKASSERPAAEGELGEPLAVEVGQALGELAVGGRDPARPLEQRDRLLQAIEGGRVIGGGGQQGGVVRKPDEGGDGDRQRGLGVVGRGVLAVAAQDAGELDPVAGVAAGGDPGGADRDALVLADAVDGLDGGGDGGGAAVAGQGAGDGAGGAQNVAVGGDQREAGAVAVQAVADQALAGDHPLDVEIDQPRRRRPLHDRLERGQGAGVAADLAVLGHAEIVEEAQDLVELGAIGGRVAGAGGVGEHQRGDDLGVGARPAQGVGDAAQGLAVRRELGAERRRVALVEPGEVEQGLVDEVPAAARDVAERARHLGGGQLAAQRAALLAGRQRPQAIAQLGAVEIVLELVGRVGDRPEVGSGGPGLADTGGQRGQGHQADPDNDEDGERATHRASLPETRWPGRDGDGAVAAPRDEGDR
jgi:hypothetical protein